MKNLLLIASILLFSSLFLNAQQLANYTFYQENLTMLNPAGITSDYTINGRSTQIGVSYRRQWEDLEDAPVNLALQFTKIIESKRISVGGYLVNDQTGEIGQSGAYLNFAYLIPFGEQTPQTLSIGLSTGLVQYRVDPTKVSFRDAGDNILTANDNTQFSPDFGFGVFYSKGQSFYAGLSVPQIFGLSTKFGGEQTFEIQRVRHYYGMIGGYLNIGQSSDSFLEPSVWIRYVANTPISIDANIRYQFNKWFWVGAGAGLSKVVHLEFGLTLAEHLQLKKGQLKAAFGMDYSWQEYGPDFGNTFELNLIYAWGE